MLNSREFCFRGYRECTSTSPLSMGHQETDIDYLSRVSDFWKSRFTQFGTIYLLPHHFLDKLDLLRYYQNYQQYPEDFKQHMLEFSESTRDRFTATDGTKIVEMFPTVNAFGGNFSVQYNEDVMGEKLKYKKEYSLADAALYVAIITNDLDFTVGCNHSYDPECYASGVFGGGKHCLASSISNYDGLSNGEDRGDVKLLNQIISIVSRRSLVSAGLNLVKKETVIDSYMKISKEAAFGTYGDVILSDVREIQKQEVDAYLRKQFGLDTM